MQLEKTQTSLNCHYKFVSVKNIIILFVSSDDSTRFKVEKSTNNLHPLSSDAD